MNKPKDVELEGPERVEAYYERSVRWLIPFGILFFVAIGFALLYLGILTPNKSMPFAARGIISLLGMAALYLGYVGLRLFPFRYAQVVADQTGLRVTTLHHQQFYPWSDISRACNHSVLQTLDVYSARGVRILSVDYFMNEFPVLRECIFQNLTRGNWCGRQGARVAAP